jgi:hypothetical protein
MMMAVMMKEEADQRRTLKIMCIISIIVVHHNILMAVGVRVEKFPHTSSRPVSRTHGRRFTKSKTRLGVSRAEEIRLVQ